MLHFATHAMVDDQRPELTGLALSRFDERGRPQPAFLRLHEIQSPRVKQIRGKGLWAGIVLKAEAGGARRFCEALMERGLLCKETHWNVIRLAPPLVITKEEIDWALAHLAEVLQMP